MTTSATYAFRYKGQDKIFQEVEADGYPAGYGAEWAQNLHRTQGKSYFEKTENLRNQYKEQSLSYETDFTYVVNLDKEVLGIYHYNDLLCEIPFRDIFSTNISLGSDLQYLCDKYFLKIKE